MLSKSQQLISRETLLTVEKTVKMDDDKPIIEDVKPSGSDWYYSDSISDIDVTGKTSPNATVQALADESS